MVRIIAVDVNNVMTPLEPANDTDFHFDSDEPGATVASYYYGDEAHAMERSVELKAGQLSPHGPVHGHGWKRDAVSPRRLALRRRDERLAAIRR